MKKYSDVMVFIVSLLVFNNAYAVSCADLDSGIFDSASDMTSIASLCQDANTNNDSEKALNSGEFFGISTWSLLEKTGESTGSLYVDSVGDVSGTFSFDSTYWDANDYIVVVLKGGVTAAVDDTDTSAKHGNKGRADKKGKPEHGVKWSAYLLEQNEFEGYWLYGHGSNGQLKELSHLSLYGSGPAVIPVPAAVWLFSSGLLALLAFARRGQK